jgi:hypothetical protein
MSQQNSNPDNPARPTPDAPTPEQTRAAAQENQDYNRPRQNQQGQEGQKRVANDSSDPRFGLTDTEQTEAPERDYENAKDRIDDLGDTK